MACLWTSSLQRSNCLWFCMTARKQKAPLGLVRIKSTKCPMQKRKPNLTNHPHVKNKKEKRFSADFWLDCVLGEYRGIQ